MEERSIFNMVVSILSAALIIPFLVLGIVFHKNAFTVIMICIYLSLLITHFICKSIYYGKEDSTSKEVFYRLSRCILKGATTLIMIHFVLLLTPSWKWIFMGVLIGVGVLEIVIEALQKALEMNYLLAGSKILLWYWIIYTLYTFNFNVVLGTLAALIAFFSHLIGMNFQNKLVLSFDMISVILFGLFILFI